MKFIHLVFVVADFAWQRRIQGAAQPVCAPFFYLSKFFSEELALSAITNTTANTTTIQYYR